METPASPSFASDHDYERSPLDAASERHPERLQAMASLDDLAGVLWDLDGPGLG